jgi:hypothetical protein
MLLKKIFCFGGGKTKSDSEFLSYKLMLYSGKKICDKNKNNLTIVLSKKKFSERNKKPYPPPSS